MNILLDAKGIGVRFGRNWVFREIDLELRPGEVLAVRGPNGCGKSTLLRTLAGLQAPHEGRVMRGTIGYAALDTNVYAGLTAREHMVLFGKLAGRRAALPELLERVGLESEADKRAGLLSSGQKARLKLAISLAADPSVLLLDEPTASLDEAGVQLVNEIVRERAKKAAVAIATNVKEDVEGATHEIVLG